MRKVLIVIIFVLLSLIILSFYENKFFIKENNVIENEEESKEMFNSAISMMYETSAGSGEYVETTDSVWPTIGYSFNSTLSKCENGGTLTWDETTKKVLMSSNTSDRCYVYFDKITLAQACVGKNIASCIKENYQLDSSILLHNSSLTNGANDGSYRYTGGDYKLTQKAITSGYAKIENNLIKTYCGGSLNSSDYCGTSDLYYTLGYDTGETQYSKYNEVLTKAVADGYLEENQVKNFVCFGTDESICPADHLYRIIGVFDDQAKLIKHDYATEDQLGKVANLNGNTSKMRYYKGSLSTIAEYYLDEEGVINWEKSALNTEILNGPYLTNLGTTWSDKIAITTWKVGGNTFTNITQTPVKIAYQNEIVSPAEATTYNGKIGLMYVSDYGYAASQENWNTNLFVYNNELNRNNNWMHIGGNDWTITRRSDIPMARAPSLHKWYFFNIISNGTVSNDVSNSALGVRPSFYLVSSTVLQSGSGTVADPYRIS